MTASLDSRIPALDRGLSPALAAEFGLSGQQAGWIAAVCQLSGVYCDAQLAWGLDLSPRSAGSLSRRWIGRGWIRERRFDGLPPVRHVLSKALYTDLDIAEVRYRKLSAGSDLEARRRLLGFDAALQLTDEFGWLPWCATEAAKLAAADSHRIPRADLPSRTYVSGGDATTTRYWVPKRPIAIPTLAAREDLRAGPPAIFVWTADAETVADPLRAWAGGLAAVWKRLAAAGVPLRIVAITAAPERLESITRALASLRAPGARSGGGEGEAVKQLHSDIGRADYGEHGSLDNALRAYAALQQQARDAERPGAEDWRTQSLLAQRLAGGAGEPAAAGPGRTVRERHHETVEALLAEVRAGELRLTLADVAAELGVSERTVRRNWGNELAAAKRGRGR